MNTNSSKNKRDNNKSRNDTSQIQYIYSMLRRFFLLILSTLGFYIVVKTLILSYDEIKLRLQQKDLNPPNFFKPFNGPDPFDSQQFYNVALDAANKGNYDSALANFRAAVRHNNKSPLYWNDLGVTEMRMGQYDKALKRFKRSLQLDPSFQLAEKNIHQLLDYHMKGVTFESIKIFEEEQVFPQKHVLKNVKVLKALDFLDFSGKYLSNHYSNTTEDDLMRTPFVIKDFDDMWYIDKQMLNIESISQKFGDMIVGFFPQNMLDPSMRSFAKSLNKAFEQTVTVPKEAYVGVDASDSSTYSHWNINQNAWKDLIEYASIKLPDILKDDYWMESCFEDHLHFIPTFYEQLHWKVMTVGQKGASMLNHKDFLSSGSWQYQVQGRKRWHICGPENDEILSKQNFDVFNIDYSLFPNAINISCYQVTVNPGEFLYYPPNHWHQTLNLDTPTISFGSKILTKHSITKLKEEFKLECKGKGKFGFSSSDCKIVDECLNYRLEEILGLNNNTYNDVYISSNKKKLSNSSNKYDYDEEDDYVMDIDIDDTVIFNPSDLSFPVKDQFKWRDCRQKEDHEDSTVSGALRIDEACLKAVLE